MPFPRALELFEHWQDTPPVSEMLHLLAGAFTSWKPGGKKAATPEQMAAAVSQMGGAVLSHNALPAWMQVSLDAWKSEGKPN